MDASDEDCIARASVAALPVLILDEATRSIDTYTDRLVQRSTDALMTGCTSFVISYRLSNVKDANWVLVMERGNLQELLAQKGSITSSIPVGRRDGKRNQRRVTASRPRFIGGGWRWAASIEKKEARNMLPSREFALEGFLCLELIA